MGTATYYMKADGCNVETKNKIQAFFFEGMKAEHYWQKYRDCEYSGKRDLFWSGFVSRFPLVSKYMESVGKLNGDCNNEPAGFLDFGTEEDEDIKNFYLTKTGEIGYYGTVWHFAEWDGLMAFLESEFKVTHARYLSDEHINPFDLL